VIRHAAVADAEGIVGLFERVYDGGYDLVEGTDPGVVRRAVADRDRLWVLAVAGGAVVGSVVARRDPGNGSYELCRAAIDREYRGRADVGAGLGVLLRDTLRRPDCEMLYCTVRSERARRKFGREAGALEWCWTGADGGMHMFAAEREEHLFGMVFHPGRTVTRVVPRGSVLLPGSAVAREIGRLRAATRTGGYPARICARGVGEHTHESAYGRVSYSVVEASRAAVVSAVDGETPGDVRRVLWEIMDGAAPSKVEHLTVCALADKQAVIEELCRPGRDDPARRFVVRGYLPGWHKEGDARYDCVTLTASSGERTPKRLGLDGPIDDVYRSFPLRLRGPESR
jgi:hypothetical protein